MKKKKYIKIRALKLEEISVLLACALLFILGVYTLLDLSYYFGKDNNTSSYKNISSYKSLAQDNLNYRIEILELKSEILDLRIKHLDDKIKYIISK